MNVCCYTMKDMYTVVVKFNVNSHVFVLQSWYKTEVVCLQKRKIAAVSQLINHINVLTWAILAGWNREAAVCVPRCVRLSKLWPSCEQLASLTLMHTLPSTVNHSPLHEIQEMLSQLGKPRFQVALTLLWHISQPSVIGGNTNTYSPPLSICVSVLEQIWWKGHSQPFKVRINDHLQERREKRELKLGKKRTILTGKVAREEEDHGEDDQKCDVCLQDSCRVEKGKTK